MSPELGAWKFRGTSRKREQTCRDRGRDRGMGRDRGRDRLFPASLTLFLTLPATQPGSGKCFGASSILSLAAFSGWGSGTAAATEAGQIYKFQFNHTHKFQFNHTPGHKLSGNNSVFVPLALSAAEETVVRGFCSAGIWGEAEDQKCSEGSFLCLQKGSGFAN